LKTKGFNSKPEGLGILLTKIQENYYIIKRSQRV